MLLDGEVVPFRLGLGFVVNGENTIATATSFLSYIFIFLYIIILNKRNRSQYFYTTLTDITNTKDGDIEMDMSRVKQKSYNINFRALLSDGSSYNLDNYVKSVRIVSNTADYVMPYFSIKVFAPPEAVLRIQKDSSGVLFSLGMSMVNFDNSSSYRLINDPHMNTVVLKPIFMDKNPVAINEELVSSSNKDRSNNMQRELLEMLCMPKFCLDVNKYVVSGVYSDVTITEAVLALANQLPISTYVVPPDNIKKYGQIALFPGNPILNIKYLQDNYGIYNDSLRVFMTNDTLHISPMHQESSTANGNILIEVNFPVNKQQMASIILGSYKDGNPMYETQSIIVNTQTSNVSIIDSDELNTETYGNNNYYLKRMLKGGESYDFHHVTKTDRDGDIYKTRAYGNMRNNESNLNAFRAEVTGSKRLEFRFDNMDISYQDIFKPVDIHFNSKNYDSDYSGRYFIRQLSLLYTVADSGAVSQQGRMSLMAESELSFPTDNVNTSGL